MHGSLIILKVNPGGYHSPHMMIYTKIFIYGMPRLLPTTTDWLKKAPESV